MRLAQSNTQLSFIRANYPLIVFNKYSFLSAESQLQQLFSSVEIDSIYQFADSYFFTGKLAQQFPIEVGLFFDAQSSRKFWLSVKVEDAAGVITTLQLNFNAAAKHFWGGGMQYSVSDFSGKKFSTIASSSVLGNAMGQSVDIKNCDVALPRFCTEEKFCFGVKPPECEAAFDSIGNVAVTVYPYRKNDYWLFNIEFDDEIAMTKPMEITLPHWAHGTILSVAGNVKRKNKTVLKAMAAGNPITAVYSRDCISKNHRGIHKARSQDFKNWIYAMNKKGIKVLGYIQPFVAQESKYFTQAIEQHFLVSTYNGEPYKTVVNEQTVYPINLLNPAAAQWYKQVIKETLIENGYSGWVADVANGFPLDAQIPDGFNAYAAHNFYPVVWTRINREVLQETGLTDSCLVFHTSGGAGSERYMPIFETVYPTLDFNTQHGLPAAVRGVLSASVSGLQYAHSNIGGCVNTKACYNIQELLCRWIEFEAFTPFLKTSEITVTDKGVASVFGNKFMVKFLARFGKIHALLSNYFIAEAAEGRLIKPLYTEFFQPEDTVSRFHFLVGQDMLVAPAVAPSQSTVAVKFPQGEWRNIFDASTVIYSGLELKNIACPIGFPAVFVRTNSAIDTLLLSKKDLLLTP